MLADAGFWNGFHWWWIIPIAMMILCFLMMRGRTGCRTIRYKSRSPSGNSFLSSSDSSKEILDKRYALGEISKAEYEEKKRDINQDLLPSPGGSLRRAPFGLSSGSKTAEAGMKGRGI